MATVPDQPQIANNFQQNNGDLYFVNGRLGLFWPYMTSFNQISVRVTWTSTGQLSGANWTASFITYTMAGSQLYGVTPTGGANGDQVMNVQASTGAFYARPNQTLIVYPSGNQPTYPATLVMSQQNFTFYINPISSDITKIGSTNNSGTALQIARLPEASTVIGRVFYIVNEGNTNNLAGVCSYKGEPIDGFTTGSLRLVRWACIGLTPNAAGTAWHIVSYYGGNLPPTSVHIVNGNNVTSPVVVSQNLGTGLTVIMPNPSTWGKGNLFCATTWQSNASSYGVGGQFAIYTNGYFRQDTTVGKYFSLVTQADLAGRYNHNTSILFISDGSHWYIASVFTGAFCRFDNQTDLNGQGHLMTGQIALVGQSQYVSSPVGPTVDGQARLYYTKLTTTTSQTYGVIIYGNADATRGPMGSTWNRVFKDSSTVNYSALNMLQVKVAGVGLINFPLGMYPSQY
jgi:hypothetical protein